MIHGFSEKDWNDYIEGLAEESLRDRIEAHLIGCWDCWEFYGQMAHATGALRSTSESIRASLALPDRALHAGLRGVFEKLNAAESAMGLTDASRHRAIEQKLEALAAVMTPMCGSQTAINALRAAAVNSPAQSLEQVTADNWPSFLNHLKSIATVMCGETGAHLVWERGQF
jgi:hypothetical protein